MGVFDEINRMKKEGMSYSEISSSLKQAGLSDKEVQSALAQTKIKDAVSGSENNSQEKELPPIPSPNAVPPPQFSQQRREKEEFETTYPVVQKGAPYKSEDELPRGSMTQEAYPESPIPPPQFEPQQAEPEPNYPSSYPQYPGSEMPQYPDSQPSYSGTSSDTMSEVAEQVVEEQLYPIRKKIDRIIELRSTIEPKVESISERLQRIEKIIDRLQLSILQKVGEYITNTSDLKKEIVETQKSFKTHHSKGHSKNSKHHKTHASPHTAHAHSQTKHKK
jgi:hypothetical protein